MLKKRNRLEIGSQPLESRVLLAGDSASEADSSTQGETDSSGTDSSSESSTPDFLLNFIGQKNTKITLFGDQNQGQLGDVFHVEYRFDDEGQEVTEVTSKTPFAYEENSTLVFNPDNLPPEITQVVVDKADADGLYRVTFDNFDLNSISTGAGNDDVVVRTVSVSQDLDKIVGPTLLRVTLGDGDDNYEEIGERFSSEIVGGLGSDSIITSATFKAVVYTGEPNKNLDFSQVPENVEPARYRSHIVRQLQHKDSGTNTVEVGSSQQIQVYGGVDAGSENGTLSYNITTGDSESHTYILLPQGDSEVTTGASDDFIFTGSGNDTIHAGAGNDLISTGEGIDQIWGEAGDDLISGGLGADQIDAGQGSDRVVEYEVEPNQITRAEQVQASKDETDYLTGTFDFSDAPGVETLLQMVASTSEGQRLLRELHEAHQQSGAPPIKVFDWWAVADTATLERAENTIRDRDGDLDSRGAVGDAKDLEGPFKELNLDADGFPIPVTGKALQDFLRFGYFLGAEVELNRNSTPEEEPLEVFTTVIHEVVHLHQAFTGTLWPGETNGVAIEELRGALGRKKQPVNNLEFDANGLPWDVDGDGFADPESANRFHGRYGPSVNSILAELGLMEEDHYSGRRPVTEADQVQDQKETKKNKKKRNNKSKNKNKNNNKKDTGKKMP